MKINTASALLALLPLAVEGKKDCRPPVTPDGLKGYLSEEGLMANLQSLNDIAYANGGNRAFGFPGYTASVDFIYGEVQKLKGFKSWVQDFPAMFALTRTAASVVGGETFRTVALTFTPSTPEGGITRELVYGPIGDLGCSAANYAAAGIEATGKIVLVERGLCPDGTTFAGKLRAAKAAGAEAVLIHNNGPAQLTAGSLSQPSPDFAPGAIVDQEPALRAKAKLDAGETVTAFVNIDQLIEERITQNVYAETIFGDEHNLIMTGAHLDSVQAGPGINDDGSGTTLILELAKGLQHFSTKNKVRMAWWGAEENGLWGSNFFVNNMTETEVSDLLLYMNFDMVSRGYFGVFDGTGDVAAPGGPAGSEVIDELLTESLVADGKTVVPVGLTGGSDYVAFKNVIKKPVGGLFTGTGLAEDPCYHQACDNITGPVPDTIHHMARAGAHALAVLAIDGAELIPKDNATALAHVRRELDPASLMLRDLFGGASHGKPCDHDLI